MKNNIIKQTEDFSDTIFSNKFEQTYHSFHGAVEEAKHVFIKEGISEFNKNKILIFEVGFGTGLNALLAFIEAQKNHKKVIYTTIEKYVLEKNVIEKLNYTQIFPQFKSVFLDMHSLDFNKQHRISENFLFQKINQDFVKWLPKNNFDVIFFDAFSYDVQPEMWTTENFKKLYSALTPNGFLLTYSAKGIVKQNIRQAGFDVKRLKGYKKRHMLKAIKQNI